MTPPLGVGVVVIFCFSFIIYALILSKNVLFSNNHVYILLYAQGEDIKDGIVREVEEETSVSHVMVFFRQSSWITTE